jgi:tetratricopeptide (TPR) repeat protein
MLERDLAQAEVMLSEAKAHAKQLRYESAALKAADGLLLGHRGELERADQLFDEARVAALLESNRHAEMLVLIHRVQLNIDAGRFELALELALETQQLADKTRDGSEGPFARVLVALAQLALGQDVHAALEAAFQELRVVDAKHRLGFGLNRAAALWNARSQHELARQLAQEALQIARLLERPSDIVLSLVELARAQQALGDRAGYAQSRAELEIDPPAKLSSHAQRARDFFRENP